MYLGGSGAVNSYSITGNFNLTASSQSGAFTPGSGDYYSTMIGAVIGPPGGTTTGTAWGSLNGSNSTSTTFSVNFGGPYNNFTIYPNLSATLTVPPGWANGNINGNPMTVSGFTWNQHDPPLTGTVTATGAGANAPLLSTRFTRLTGTSLGSRIQGAAQLTQPGTAGNPALAANLRAAWRFRQQQRLAALRAATPGGQTSGNPAGPILALQRH